MIRPEDVHKQALLVLVEMRTCHTRGSFLGDRLGRFFVFAGKVTLWVAEGRALVDLSPGVGDWEGGRGNAFHGYYKDGLYMEPCSMQ